MRALITAALMLVAAIQVLALDAGTKAPAFSLPILSVKDAKQLVSLGELKGKVIYLDFWASWCGPCRISIPEINALQASLGSDQFEVIAINLDENPAAAEKFLRRYPVVYRVLTDPEGVVAENYALPGMPTSFIIDQSGHVSMTHVGFKPGDMTAIRAHIKSLLTNPESP